MMAKYIASGAFGRSRDCAWCVSSRCVRFFFRFALFCWALLPLRRVRHRRFHRWSRKTCPCRRPRPSLHWGFRGRAVHRCDCSPADSPHSREEWMCRERIETIGLLLFVANYSSVAEREAQGLWSTASLVCHAILLYTEDASSAYTEAESSRCRASPRKHSVAPSVSVAI